MSLRLIQGGKQDDGIRGGSITMVWCDEPLIGLRPSEYNWWKSTAAVDSSRPLSADMIIRATRKAMGLPIIRLVKG